MGAILGGATALEVDAVLVTPRCSDPMYRRGLRLSMRTVFQVLRTRIESWPGGVAEMQAEGFTVAALALSHDSVTLGEFVDQGNGRVAFEFGTEGHGRGLGDATLGAMDAVVKIPTPGGADLSNVAASAAVPSCRPR
ncbi:TrmH family RNA methyltransferase [Sanguibacter sp. 25GB23B1]|uniref:TrmH family RNA methyltransferase n=1 Tax=unclassified Sanguibacter TaxID=2645534 RepID=UPI0032AFCD40